MTNRSRRSLFCIIALSMMYTQGDAVANAPTGRYTINAGTVFDNKTGLTWQQSPLGFPTDTFYTWNDAQTACSGPWRLPTIRELQSIVDYSRSQPAMDPAFMINSSSNGLFWSANADPRPPGPPFFFSSGIGIGVVYGDTSYANQQQGNMVICVR